MRVRRGRRGKLAVMMWMLGERSVCWGNGKSEREGEGLYRLGGRRCLGGRWSGRPMMWLEDVKSGVFRRGFTGMMGD